MVQVRGFVKENRGSLTRNIAGLNRISKVLVKRRGRAGRDLRYAPGGAEQPVPRRQPEAGHPGHPRQRRRARSARCEDDPLAALCTLVEPARDCDVIKDALGPARCRARAPFAGDAAAKPRVPEPIDRSLGGLVEVTR